MSRYSVHPGVAMVQNWIATLKARSGRSLDEWLVLLKNEGPSTEAARRDWLKTQFKLGTNSASWLAERSFGRGHEEDTPELYLKNAESYVACMFAGKSAAALKPLYDALLSMSLSIASDVKACPCKTIVPLYRHHVFAQIKPMAKRIDMGFALKETALEGRLIDTGGFAKKDRITHRIPITCMHDIDDEVRHWLRVAYAMDDR